MPMGRNEIALTAENAFAMNILDLEPIKRGLPAYIATLIEPALQDRKFAELIDLHPEIVIKNIDPFAKQIQTIGERYWYGAAALWNDFHAEQARKINKMLQRVSECLISASTFNMLTTPQPGGLRIGFTGHRDGMGVSQVGKALQNLIGELMNFQPEVEFHHGGARGSDLFAAMGARSAGAKTFGHYPFPSEIQTRGWSQPDISLHNEIKAGDTGRRTYSQTFRTSAYFERNRGIVDSSQLMTSRYDGRNYGGTKNAIDYALQLNRPILNTPNFKDINPTTAEKGK